MQMIASFHAENWQEIAEEEERKLDAEWPVLPESEKRHARQAQECVQLVLNSFHSVLKSLPVGHGNILSKDAALQQVGVQPF